MKTAVVLLTVVVLLGATWFALSGERALHGTREVAAQFLGVEPAVLVFERSVARAGDNDDSTTDDVWLAPPTAGESPVHVSVSRERRSVTMASWGNGEPPEGQAQVSQEEALDVAVGWLARFPADIPADDVSWTLGHPGQDRPVYLFRWRHVGEDGPGYSISLQVSAVTGHPLMFSALVLPPEPKATTPVRLTPAEAEARARAAAEARPGYTVLAVDVRSLDTDSAFAPHGEPVYPVLLDATVHPPGSTHTFDADDYWEVHATTGEVFVGPGLVEEPKVAEEDP